MAALLNIDLEKILMVFNKNKNQYPYFVETGTYMGETILRFIDDFEKSYTIELSDELHKIFNQKDYDRNKLKSLLGDSSIILKEVINELNGNTIFFLDGHFSSCGTAKGVKDVPLIEELKLINDNFNYESLIIIDDLRLFGTNFSENWSNITNENLLKILENRLDSYLELNDRLILKVNEK
jgi:hypothetical protein